MMLVTIERAKRQLRHDTDDHDAEVAELIEEASAVVMKHIKCDTIPNAWNEPEGSPSGTGIPGDVKLAALLLIGEIDRHRGASMAELLSPAAVSLLEKYRVPSLA